MITFSDILQAITALGVIIALLTNAGTIRQRGDVKVTEQAEMKADIKHIREKVDKIDSMGNAITALTESCKSAHKRIDEHLALYHGQHPPRGSDDP
jgi:S-adenosylmethionine hydrolase